MTLISKSSRRERGASAVTVAISMVVLMGMAAIAIDVGAAFNERRQDQTVSDLSSLAGAIDFRLGPEAVRDQALTLAETNLTISYTASEWQTSWEGCTDPNKNDGGFEFDPVPSPWSGGDIDCISIDDAGYVRVRVPDQLVDTTFGRILGIDAISVDAAAIAQIEGRGGGGVLPFAVVGSGGSHYCLRSNTGGGGPGGGGGGGGGSGAQDPCDGPNTGNFGTIDSPLFGNPDPDVQTSKVCSQTAQFRVLATNIALGLDHPVFINDNWPGGTIVDACGNQGINSSDTDQGMGQGTEQGLVNGSSSDFHSPVAIPRLQNTPFNTEGIKGEDLDDWPLWKFLLPNNTVVVPDNPQTTVNEEVRVVYGNNAPADCHPDGFDGGSFDWDGDPSTGDVNGEEPNSSWQHMNKCLEDYRQGLGGTPPPPTSFVQMFSSSLEDTPRFAYVPEYWENSFPSGTSTDLNIQRFRSIWIQGLWFGSGNNQGVFHPGETPSGNFNQGLRQVSGFILPDDALPDSLRSDPPPFANTGFFETILFR